MSISPDHYLDTIVSETESLAHAAEGSLDVRVPPCPEWSMADLVGHVASVHNFWGQIAKRRPLRNGDGCRRHR